MDDATPRAGNAYRDGRVHVMARRCATCVFRPGNPMSLEPGRLAKLIAANVDAEAALICHRTLYREDCGEAVCRGFWTAHLTLPLLLARLAGAWVEVDADGRPASPPQPGVYCRHGHRVAAPDPGEPFTEYESPFRLADPYPCGAAECAPEAIEAMFPTGSRP